MSHIPKIEKQKKDREKQEKVKRVIRAGLDYDYNIVFSTPEGVRVMNDILSMTHQFQTSFSFDGKGQIDFREGERNIGLKLISKMSLINQSALFKAFKINLKKEYVKK